MKSKAASKPAPQPQRKLGKGLSALMGENYSQTAAAPASAGKTPGSAAPRPLDSSMPMLPLSRIVAGKFQPRMHFSEEQLYELADSIKKNGVMQPIIVRPSPEREGTFEIIAGERRWRAAKHAGLEEIPVILRELDDKQALELALVENVQRQDLRPLEEAKGYQRLLDEFAYTQEELSSTVGKSRSHITNLLRLLTLPEEVKNLLDEDKITMGHARALLNAKNPTALAQEIVRRGLNVRQTENLTRIGGGEAVPNARGKEKKQPSSMRRPSAEEGKPKDPDILALEETLSENLGLRVSINDRGQSGEIVVQYQSLTELDEILRRLGGSI